MVLPLPLMVPPDQFNDPLTVRSPLPLRVPALRLADGNGVVTLAKLARPPLMFSTLLLNGPAKLIPPPEKVAVPLMLTLPASELLPEMTVTWPAPLMPAVARQQSTEP